MVGGLNIFLRNNSTAQPLKQLYEIAIAARKRKVVQVLEQCEKKSRYQKSFPKEQFLQLF